jgi:death on curing protein
MPISNPIFLSLEDVLEFHADQVASFGGDATVRDRGLLESAIAQPRQMLGGEYLHKDLVEMAAAYLFHIVANHPFVDGNKRTGAHAAHVFLELNGISIALSTNRTGDVVLQVATGKITKEHVAKFFRDLIRDQNPE